MKSILIITDSKTHQETDDIFHICSRLKKLGNIVYILDRDFPENTQFFNKGRQQDLFAYELKDSNFTFFDYSQKNIVRHSISKEEIDLILLRIDRPISDTLLTSIEVYFNNQLIINKPSGIIKTASKEFLFSVKEVCPPMKLCKTYDEIIEFSQAFPIVIKPLKGYGGKNICRILNNKFYHENIEIDEPTFRTLLETFLKQDKKLLVVEYLKNVSLGDKRIYVVNGNIIGATNRIPKDNSWIGNVQQGATVSKTSISLQEELIISKINKVLLDKGIYIYGADILINNNHEPILSEINTLNVGGCNIIDELYDSNCIDIVVDSILCINKF